MIAVSFQTKPTIAKLPIPQSPTEALIKVRLAGICNTDIEITRGYQQFQGILGHEFVGEVVAAPQQEWVGQRVVGEINAGCGSCATCQQQDSRHCPQRTVLGIWQRNGAFADYLTLPMANLLPVAANVSDEMAVFTEPLAAAYEVTRYLQPFDRVLVLGDGKLGLLIALSLQIAGYQPLLIGKHANKLALARNWQIQTSLVSEFDPQSTGFTPFDVVVEASGAPTAMELALAAVRPQGKIILKSTYAGKLTLDAARIVVKELQLIGSRCGRFAAVLPLLASGKLPVTDLITREFPLTAALDALEYAQQPGVLKVLLRPDHTNL
jgi:2-desacetyl-2-hydroxyethyl bacteriochlorophyllide A dehydrogenase